MKEDKLDWFASVTLNPDKDYAHFSIAGYDDRNTIMKSPEEYKKNNFVQNLFTDESGNFNKKVWSINMKNLKITFSLKDGAILSRFTTKDSILLSR